MFAPPRMGFRAHRVKLTRNTLGVEPSTLRATFLSSKSSASSQAKPPTGVITKSTGPTPLKQCLVVQGQDPFSFHEGRALVPYFSAVSSLSGPMFHWVL